MPRSWTTRPESAPTTAPAVSNLSGNTPTRKSRADRSSASVTSSSRMRASSLSVSVIAGIVTSVLTAARAANGPDPRRRSKPAPAQYVYPLSSRRFMFRRELKRPPRIALITETAWKSGIRRGRPRWPIRISDWTAPGRWMIRTSRSFRAGVSAMAPRSATAGDAVQAPNRRSTVVRTSSPESRHRQ